MYNCVIDLIIYITEEDQGQAIIKKMKPPQD